VSKIRCPKTQSGDLTLMQRYGIYAAIAVALIVGTWFVGSYFGLFRILFPTEEQQLVDQMFENAKSGGSLATFTDSEVRRWQLADGHRLERLSLDVPDAVVARLTSQVPLDMSPARWETQGLSMVFPLDIATRFNGRRIEIGIVARTAQANGSPELKAVYATQQAGNSGWKSIRVGPKFELHKFTFDIPAVNEGYRSMPILVIHSDAEGKGRAVELLGVYIGPTKNSQ
jgi:hypothetical protein